MLALGLAIAGLAFVLLVFAGEQHTAVLVISGILATTAGTLLLAPLSGNEPHPEHTLVDGLIELNRYNDGMRRAREIEVQQGKPDSVLVSVGGGGLIAGIAAWFGGRSRVIALEPELAPTLHKARETGAPVDSIRRSCRGRAVADRVIGLRLL